MTALKPRDRQLVLARLALPVIAGGRGCAVSCGAADLAHLVELATGIGHPDNDHDVMEEGAVEAGQGGLLPTVLGSGTAEHTADLADQRALRPEAAGVIEEISHLPGHVSEPRRAAEDDRIGGG